MRDSVLDRKRDRARGREAESAREGDRERGKRDIRGDNKCS